MKKIIIPVLCIVVLLSASLVSYYIGYQKGKKEAEPSKIFGTTFYAEIKEIYDNNTILVEGLEINDINFRSLFTLSVDEDTELEWRYTEIDFSDLKLGQRISITFTGVILESYPGQIKGVDKIVLLDDQV